MTEALSTETLWKLFKEYESEVRSGYVNNRIAAGTMANALARIIASREERIKEQ